MASGTDSGNDRGIGADAEGRIGRAARGFTLIELLVVIGIIAILIGLTLAVGAKVSGSGKARVTDNAIKILDTAASAFEATRDGLPPAIVQYTRPGGDPEVPNDNVLRPVADAYRMDSPEQQINSVGWFMFQAEKVPEVAPIFQKLDPKLVRKVSPEQWDPSKWNEQQPELATVVDGWGNPIRYVHPTWDGLIHGGAGFVSGNVDASNTGQAVPVDNTLLEFLGLPSPPEFPFTNFTQIRRNNQVQSASETPDSDGGICTGNKPYFYSAGADGKVGYLVDGTGKVLEDYNADNVYTVVPQFQRAP